MNERVNSQTSNTEKIQPMLNELIDKVVVQERTADDPFQQVYLPPDEEGNARTGFVTGVGELRDEHNELMYDEGQKVRLVGEVTYINKGEQRTAKGELSKILAIDAGIRDKLASDRERQLTFSKDLGEFVLQNKQTLSAAVVSPERLPVHLDDEFEQTVSRSDVLTQIAEQADVSMITGIPENLRPEGYVAPTQIDSYPGQRVSVNMPSNPHAAKGFPAREEYLKLLGEESK